MASIPPTNSTPIIESPNPLGINPPLLNSANPWATTYSDLKALYDSPHTGAVTIRTSLWEEFSQHPSTHQYTFFSSSVGHATTKIDTTLAEGRGVVAEGETSSLNTLGYSPISFTQYQAILQKMCTNEELTRRPPKPFIISVTGSAEEVGEMCLRTTEFQNEENGLRIMMEINLSCPNIPDKPPPAYDTSSLIDYLSSIGKAKSLMSAQGLEPLLVGIKTPPYTYQGQFQSLINALETSTKPLGECPVNFITATNTLGSCLILNAATNPALGSVNGLGIGGMAGDALHPIALGNVKTIRAILDASESPEIRKIAIIGVGGVGDAAGYQRMRSVGACAVGVGTALGREGVSIFEKISQGLLPY